MVAALTLALVAVGVAAAWAVFLLPLAVMVLFVRRFDPHLASAGLHPASWVSLPRLRLWRGHVEAREAVATLNLRWRPSVHGARNLVLAVRADTAVEWRVGHGEPPTDPATAAAVAELTDGLPAWELGVGGGWLVLAIDPITAVAALSGDDHRRLLTGLAALATALETAEPSTAAPAPAPEGFAVPAGLVWGALLLAPALGTLVAVPLALGAVALGAWGV